MDLRNKIPPPPPPPPRQYGALPTSGRYGQIFFAEPANPPEQLIKGRLYKFWYEKEDNFEPFFDGKDTFDAYYQGVKDGKFMFMFNGQELLLAPVKNRQFQNVNARGGSRKNRNIRRRKYRTNRKTRRRH